MVVGRQRSNSIIKIDDSGVRMDGVDADRNATFQHFHSYFQLNSVGRTRTDKLGFKTISHANGIQLGRCFEEEEVRQVVCYCDSFQNFDLDGLTLVS